MLFLKLKILHLVKIIKAIKNCIKNIVFSIKDYLKKCIKLSMEIILKTKFFLQSYFLILFSGLFDRKYYIKKYNQNLKFFSKIFPLFHYIIKGWQLKYEPSDNFGVKNFLKKYFWCDENPLYYYLKNVVKNGTYLFKKNRYKPNKKDIDKYIKAKAKRGKSNKVIYTCITNDYDDLNSIKSYRYVDSSYDYICYTDNKDLIKAKTYGIWEIRPLEYTKLDNTRNGRWHKIHPHILFPDYDESIYIDANINILSNRLFKTLKKWKKDLLLPLRLEHQCIYEEYKWIYKEKVDIRSIVRKEWKLIKQAGMPRNYGAFETNLIYRKHNLPEIINLMEEWWYFIENYSKRDQLSFPYIMWKNKRLIEDYAFHNLKPYYKDYCLFTHCKERI